MSDSFAIDSILSQTFHISWGCLGVQRIIQKPSAWHIEDNKCHCVLGRCNFRKQVNTGWIVSYLTVWFHFANKWSYFPNRWVIFWKTGAVCFYFLKQPPTHRMIADRIHHVWKQLNGYFLWLSHVCTLGVAQLVLWLACISRTEKSIKSITKK